MRFLIWRATLKATRRLGLPLPIRAEIANWIANVGRGWL